jgi:tetratricopeptide (TPR) repeat protein
MLSSEPDFTKAVAFYQQGRLIDAERVCQDILRRRPDHFDSWYLLGLIMMRTGRAAQGVEHLRRAVALNPTNADTRNDLANGLRALGHREEALVHYDLGVSLQPGHWNAWFNRGGTFLELQRPAEALASFDKVIALLPKLAEAHKSRGAALTLLNRLEDATASYKRALALKPDDADAYQQLGWVLSTLKRLDEAVLCYDAAIALRPDDHAALINRGTALLGLNRPADALDSLDRAVGLKPDDASGWTNRGVALLGVRRPEEAIASHDKAIALRPDFIEAHNNRGAGFWALNRHADAIESYARAIALKPDFASPNWNQSLCQLALGQYEAGWDLFEWRWKVGIAHQNGDPPGNRWLGETAAGGKTILIRAEQGLGDSLQFCRYVPMLAARASVMLEVPRPLVRLLSGLKGLSGIVATGDPLPAFDRWTSMMSLPKVFGTTLATIPADIPYLHADPAEVDAWRRRLTALAGRKVGLVWAGSPRPEDPRSNAVDRRRSMTLADFAPLANVPDICLISLQVGEPAAQARTPPAGMTLHDWTNELTDFADTAALVEALDLVVSVDTSVVHLAGALGKPIWVLNRFDQCWRWLTGRTDSPWYPSARLFQQRTPGDWIGPIGAVAEALRSSTDIRGMLPEAV